MEVPHCFILMYKTCFIKGIFEFMSKCCISFYCRSAGIGFSSAAARLSSIACPFILLLGEKTFPSLPLYIFGLSALIAGLLVLLLPETTGKKLPESVEEAESIYGW